MKKIITLVLLVALISPISALAFPGGDYVDERFAVVNERLATLEQQAQQCQNNNQLLASKIMQLENKVATVEARYDKLEEVVKTFQQQLINSYTIIINFIKSFTGRK